MTEQASDAGSAPVLEVFSQASAVRARPDGTFDADVSGQWTIGGRPSGGYLLALLARTASSLTDSRHVIAASAHYLRSPDPGPVEIEGEVLRSGRSISQVRARMSQGGRPCVEGLISTGELDASTAPRWDGGVPDIQHVPFDGGIRLPPLTPDGIPVAMLQQVDLRVDPESSGIMTSRPSGLGQLRGWLKLLGGESFDPISLLYAIDAFPPATFDTDFGCWMSTVEMTAYVRALPVPGPVRIVSRVRLIDPQWVDQACDIWDGTGRLVAQATQLAKVLG